jgi:hypothetical protein
MGPQNRSIRIASVEQQAPSALWHGLSLFGNHMRLFSMAQAWFSMSESNLGLPEDILKCLPNKVTPIITASTQEAG